MKHQVRDKFFYASPSIFPDWPYRSRYAIGMRLSDFMAINEPYYRFEVNGSMYEIEANKAKVLGKKYKMNYGALPNIIPLSEFNVVYTRPIERQPMQSQLF